MLGNKHLKLQAQQVIMNVHHYFERERDNGGACAPFTSVMQRTAEACGRSDRTLTNIKKRFRDVAPNQPEVSFKRKKNNGNHVRFGIASLEEQYFDITTNIKQVLIESTKSEKQQNAVPRQAMNTTQLRDIKLPTIELISNKYEHSNQTISTTKSLTKNGNSESELSDPVYEDDDDIEAKMREQEDLEKCVEEINKPIEDITSDDWIMVKFEGKENVKILCWVSGFDRG
ncbi:hypothetical protein FQA39_LY15669 [Lamprigera yunnana]|nr:hypothetical protein FQA39_LY15669 [Lamprigera yunnana]